MDNDNYRRGAARSVRRPAGGSGVKPRSRLPWHGAYSWPRVAFALALAFAATWGHAADPAKTLRVVFTIAETSFDPQFASDAASDGVISNIYEAMLDYDYLARPVKVVPRTLESMPVIEDEGRTYICHIRRGIFFTADAAFKGKPRELTAADYAYGIKRLLDPAVKSPWIWLVEGKIAGSAEAIAKAAKAGRFDYEAAIPGLELVDRYTLKIRLAQPDLRFIYVLAVPNVSAVAREVVEAYGVDFGAHPVGTGPYMLGAYKRSSKIVLDANPGYRESTYAPSGPIPVESQAIAAALKGRRLPFAGHIDISVIEEGQARWLAFLNRELDILDLIPPEFVVEALIDGKLRPELAARGIKHELLLRPNTWWTYFDMEDPVVGGYTPEKIALRRAIGMGNDVAEYIRVVMKGRAVPATSIVPPDIVGYDPALKLQAQLYDPGAARALLDRFGYKDRDGDGYRETPDGKPLVLEMWSPPTSFFRQADELWKKNMDAIGLRIVFKKDRTSELRKMARLGKIPMRYDGWNADYPDAENYMQLLYGPNTGGENNARFKLRAFDALYDEARTLPDSPQRTKLFERMTELVIAYAPWRLSEHRLEDPLVQGWVKYYKPHPIRSQVWQYVDVDPRK
jgi:peptide/nickel transport system substrate-binding protein